MKKNKNIPGEYLTPFDVEVFIGDDYTPQNRTNWEEVASPLTEGYRLVIRKKNRGKRTDVIDIFGVINPFGKIIIPLEYNDIGHCSENTFTVELNSQYALIDIDNKFIIPFDKFDCIGSMKEGIVSVAKNNKVGFVDRLSRVVIDFQYDIFESFRSMPSFTFGCCALKQNDKYGIIDHNNNVIVPFKWDYAQIMSGDRIIVDRYIADACGSKETGIINFKSEWVIPLANRTYVPVEDHLWREYIFDDNFCPFLTPDGIVPIGDRNVLEYWQYVMESMELYNNFSIDKLIEGVGELREFVQSKNDKLLR